MNLHTYLLISSQLFFLKNHLTHIRNFSTVALDIFSIVFFSIFSRLYQYFTDPKEKLIVGMHLHIFLEIIRKKINERYALLKFLLIVLVQNDFETKKKGIS